MGWIGRIWFRKCKIISVDFRHGIRPKYSSFSLSLFEIRRQLLELGRTWFVSPWLLLGKSMDFLTMSKFRAFQADLLGMQHEWLWNCYYISTLAVQISYTWNFQMSYFLFCYLLSSKIFCFLIKKSW